MDIIFDIGSSNIKMLVREKDGTIYPEMSIVLSKKSATGNDTFVNFGKSAIEEYKSDLSNNLSLIYPIVSSGKIVNFSAFKYLITEMVKNVIPKKSDYPKQNVLILVSQSVGFKEREHIDDIFSSLGFRHVFIIESVIAAGRMVKEKQYVLVDIGADKTEIAFMDGHSVLIGGTVDVGENTFQSGLVTYSQKVLKAFISKRTASEIINGINSVSPDCTSVYTASVSKLPMHNDDKQDYTALDLRRVIGKELNSICEVIIKLYKELAINGVSKDIVNNIIVFGGAFYIDGLTDMLKGFLHKEVFPMKDILFANLLGGAFLLDNNMQELKEILNIKED